MSNDHPTESTPKKGRGVYPRLLKYADFQVNDQFGQLTIIGEPVIRTYIYKGKAHQRVIYYPVRCTCGVEKEIAGKLLGNGDARSCGCSRAVRLSKMRSKHRESLTRLYRIWDGMNRRCEVPRGRGYRYYGSRGITVCEGWKDSYETFRDWAMASGYRDDLTIERKDVNGNYCPENCTWIPQGQQARNRRTSVYYEAFGKRQLVGDFAREYNMHVVTLWQRVRRFGGDIERALTEPPRYKPKS